jgi:hypothetical protein
VLAGTNVIAMIVSMRVISSHNYKIAGEIELRWEDYRNSKIAKTVHLTPTQYRKSKFIREETFKGNLLAKQYLEKLRKEEVSIDWAHRVLINGIRQQRMLKMMTIADNRESAI